MALLRWSSEEARRLYARIGERVQISLLDAAVDANFETVRSHTLLAATATGGAGSRVGEASAAAARAVNEAMELVGRAHAFIGALPSPEALPSIDDDNDIRRVSEAVTALRSEAAKADRALELDDGAEEPDDEPASH